MLFRAAALTVGQIADPVFRGVVIKSVLFTLCLFTGLTVVFYMARPDVTYFEWEWLNDIAELGGSLAFFAFLVLTFSMTATLIGGIFLDDIAEAPAIIRARHPASRRNSPKPSLCPCDLLP